MASSDDYLRQAELTARLALAESDPDKAEALHLMVLDLYDRAAKTKAEEAAAETARYLSVQANTIFKGPGE